MADLPLDLSIRLELYVECNHLAKADVLSKSDPICALHLKDTKTGTFQEICRTEMIPNNHNPKFAKPLLIDYKFEELQIVRFAIYDVDNDSSTLEDDDFLGSYECSVAEIARSLVKKKPLESQRGRKSLISVVAVEVPKQKQKASAGYFIKILGRDLAKKDFFGKSDPYVIIYKKQINSSFLKLYKSEYIEKTLNPDWAPIFLSNEIPETEAECTLRLEVWDWDRCTKDDMIGYVEMTAAELQQAQNQEFALHPPHGKSKSVGKLVINTRMMSSLPSFVDYLKGGLELNLSIAIDFTASNGTPTDPSSLHYVSPMPNQYQQAIRAVGDILMEYDSDKIVPVFGFGGMPPGRSTSHCFPLSGDGDVKGGVDEILKVYNESVQHVSLSCPTCFAPSLANANKVAEAFKKDPKALKYLILLIITDGEICDVDDSISAIVKGSRLPMSVVIVGVGEASFTSMHVLDSDNQMLKASGGKEAVRDIVQFVPFRECQETPGMLAHEVLAELPAQIVQHFLAQNTLPSSCDC
eukprot:TRINITY_DN8755_c0_g1::TRINITY_DN8755_c0_g1_i1::g.23877::m.23877 TRINITY_DN8755_c0_g1::TRINITY_DN8755_c0_g1_i1::g.23877  ORF type:complete len:524 (+),score=111.99,sp/Q8BT60/CPNE3_MOUSE/38.67/3e-113,Copine/PF07002.11/5.6e-42,C2/PF00168.25/3.1e-10,C2/PF00168.25/3.6e-14,vWA-TerF-like/PF10138.4/0.0019 TRINITY_DN8755_c0_g1_i1:163-1734(+)